MESNDLKLRAEEAIDRALRVFTRRGQQEFVREMSLIGDRILAGEAKAWDGLDKEETAAVAGYVGGAICGQEPEKFREFVAGVVKGRQGG